ncbi:MAG: hypothetical protein ACREHD_20960, partial [Pirellulales bacterium]
MKILFAIPHFYDPQGGAAHQSLNDNAPARVDALAACLRNLHHLFGQEQSGLDIARRVTLPANTELRHAVDVVICTAGERHLLSQLPFDRDLYHHHV